MKLAQFESMHPSADGPARGHREITFDEDVTTDHGIVFRGVYNGSDEAGDITIIQMDGSEFTIPNVPAGARFPVFCRGVAEDDTTVPEAMLRGIE